MPLSAAQLSNAEQAAGHLRSAASSLRLLRFVRWPAEHRRKFLRNETLPTPVYPSFDAAPARSDIKQARNLLAAGHPVTDWLLRCAGTLDRTSALLQSVGTADFYTHSCALFGAPDKLLLDRQTRTIDLALHMDAALHQLSSDNLILGAPPEVLSAAQFASRLRKKLKTHFDEPPRVILADNLSAKALAGRTRIRVDRGAQFTARDVRQLLHHEALTHVATAQNGRAQIRFPILGSAHPGTTEIQEGLAVFAEIITGAMDPYRFRRLSGRVIAIDMAASGADFKQVFDYFAEQGIDAHEAYENTRRVFRGGVISGGAPFTKDGVYLNGLLRVHNFLRTITTIGRADLIRLLFAGKLDLEDIPALAHLAKAGAITPPALLPPWAKDMSFLVSYLAYSSFLNQVKLPGLQNYYRDLLKAVPDIWGFAKPSSGN